MNHQHSEVMTIDLPEKNHPIKRDDSDDAVKDYFRVGKGQKNDTESELN